MLAQKNILQKHIFLNILHTKNNPYEKEKIWHPPSIGTLHAGTRNERRLQRRYLLVS